MTRPALARVQRVEGIRSVTPDRHYFACRVTRFVAMGALGVRDESYMADYVRHQVEFLNCLLNPADERFVYDIRIISQPDPELYSRGRIHAAIVVRLDRMSHEEAQLSADALLRLLRSGFNEYDFESATQEDLLFLLKPFPVEHLVGFSRRCGWQPLDSVRTPFRPPRIGFGSAAGDARPDADEGKVFHIFPFLSSFAPFTGLFRLLQLQPAPIALSCRLNPTRLRPDEEDFLEAQIAQCEKYAQLHLGSFPDDLEYLKPTLQRQSLLHEQYLIRLLHGLKDDAAVMTVQLASPLPIPFTLADSVGHLISDPAAVASISAGGAPGRGTIRPGGDDVWRYLSGGYEVIPEDGDSEQLVAFSTLDMPLPRHPLAPPSAARVLHLFDAGEAAGTFRLPQATDEALVGVEVRRARYQPAPPVLPNVGGFLGISGGHTGWQEVRVAPDDRMRHIYIVGQTGTGKTTMLKSMILEDIAAGAGVCLIDPHGDLFRELLGRIPEHRIGDVVLLDPADTEYPVGLNLLELQDESQRHFVVQEMTGIIWRLMLDAYGVRGGEFMGPAFFQHMRYNLLLVMSRPDQPGTLVDFCRTFSVPDYWKRWTPLQSADPELQYWVEKVLPRQDYLGHGEGEISLGTYLRGKFEEFIFDPMVRNIFGQRRSTIDLRRVMDGGKILLVNLAKGLLTEATSRFVGMVLLAKLQVAAMSRVRMRVEDRRPFYAYVDEFQSIASENFVSMLSEGRKFGLGLVLANQFISQVENARIMGSVFGNAGTLVAFRVGQGDVELMERTMWPVFSRSDLTSLPNWQAAMTTLVNGQAVQPFTVETVLPSAPYDRERAEKVRAASRARFARPRAAVEREIQADTDGKHESE